MSSSFEDWTHSFLSRVYRVTLRGDPASLGLESDWQYVSSLAEAGVHHFTLAHIEDILLNLLASINAPVPFLVAILLRHQSEDERAGGGEAPERREVRERSRELTLRYFSLLLRFPDSIPSEFELEELLPSQLFEALSTPLGASAAAPLTSELFGGVLACVEQDGGFAAVSRVLEPLFTHFMRVFSRFSFEGGPSLDQLQLAWTRLWASHALVPQALFTSPLFLPHGDLECLGWCGRDWVHRTFLGALVGMWLLPRGREGLRLMVPDARDLPARKAFEMHRTHRTRRFHLQSWQLSIVKGFLQKKCPLPPAGIPAPTTTTTPTSDMYPLGRLKTTQWFRGVLRANAPLRREQIGDLSRLADMEFMLSLSGILLMLAAPFSDVHNEKMRKMISWQDSLDSFSADPAAQREHHSRALREAAAGGGGGGFDALSVPLLAGFWEGETRLGADAGAVERARRAPAAAVPAIWRVCPFAPVGADADADADAQRMALLAPELPSFVSECFFLAAEVLRVGLAPILRIYEKLLKRTFEGMQRENRGDLTPPQQQRLKEMVDDLLRQRYMMEMVLFDPLFMGPALRYAGMCLHWCAETKREQEAGTAAPEHQHFSLLPEFMVEDCCFVISLGDKFAFLSALPVMETQVSKLVIDLVSLLSISPSSAPASSSSSSPDEMTNASSPSSSPSSSSSSSSSSLIRNPYIRGKIINVLDAFCPNGSHNDAAPLPSEYGDTSLASSPSSPSSLAGSPAKTQGVTFTSVSSNMASLSASFTFHPPQWKSDIQEGQPFLTAADALESLPRSLLQFYVDAEFLGGSNSFYEKFNMRYYIADLVTSLWSFSPRFRADMVALGRDTGAFVPFVNMIINDSTFLLDESLTKLADIRIMQKREHEYEAQMAQGASIAQRDINEHTERLQHLERTQSNVKSLLLLANETILLLECLASEMVSPFLHEELSDRFAGMLNYFVQQLCGRTCAQLRVENPEELHFKPRELLARIVDIFVHFTRERPASDGDPALPPPQQRFIESVARDERAFDQPSFDRVAGILSGPQGRALSPVPSSRSPPPPAAAPLRSAAVMGDWASFLRRAKEARENWMASRMELEDEDEWDVPDAFSDPITCSLMRDPVRLPSSKQVLDRATIKRHLLSDRTDPFNRSPLVFEEIEECPELKQQIEAWIQEQRKKK